jgi:alanyl-tRNA synthetase
MITTRLYYHDSYLRNFAAQVVGRSPDGLLVYLDRTAFYPSSGGQPNDLGWISGVPVLDVIDEKKRIAHALAAPVSEDAVECRLDWPRRFDHMQQHSGQHVLSALAMEMYGCETVGFHLGAEVSTVDLAAESLEPEKILALEQAVNECIFGNHPVKAIFEAEADAEAQGLRRKPSGRTGMLRVVLVEGVDRSPCGGTHVRSTAEIGPVLIRKIDKMHGAVRVEFLCGLRAIRRARADFEVLGRIARLFSAPIDDCPGLAENQRKSLLAAGKTCRRLSAELARRDGEELYRKTAPGCDGIRRVLRRQPSGALDDEARAFAQGFTGQPKAVLVAASDDPPSVLLAVSGDAGIDAGGLLREAISRAGGRGGGAARIAQGSVASVESLDGLLADLMRPEH